MMRHCNLRLLAPVCTLLAGVLLVPVSASAQDVRFGYIDSARIFAEYLDAKEAQARFDRQVEGWRNEAAEMERKVAELRKEVREQGPILSALKRQEKEAQLQRAISEQERFIQDVWGPTGRAALENERATSEVVARIRAVVEEVAGKKGLNLVLDAASGFVIYADKTFDLTAEVIQELNAQSSLTGTGTTN